MLIRVLASVDVPMAVSRRMRFGSRGDRIQQHVQSVLGLDAAEIGAMRAQFSKQRSIVRGHSLADNGDPEPWQCGEFRRRCRTQAVAVIKRSFSKRIHLVRGPKVRRELFHELRGRVHPIRMFESGRKTNLLKFLKPFFYLRVRKGV